MLLKDLFDFLPKSKRSASYGKPKGDYPFFTSSNTIDKYVSEPDYDGMYLIIGDGGTGNCKFYDGKFSVSDHNYVLKPNKGTNAKCIQYFLAKDNYDILNRGFKGIGIKNVSKTYIENINYKYNSDYSEDYICESIGKIEAIIKKAEEKLLLLDSLIKSRFIELFMNGNKDRYPLSNWEDVVTIKHGKDYKKNIVEHGGYPVYGSGGFMGVYTDKYLVNENATIIGRKGTIDKPIFVNEKFWNVDTAFGIEVNEKILNPLFFFVRSTLYDLKAFSTSTTLPSMTKDTLHKITIGIPPLELQNSFANFVIQIDKSKFNYFTKIQRKQAHGPNP